MTIIPSSELIARIATMKKQPSPEKVWKLQHALEVNNDEMQQSDFVCMYRNCLHHSSRHGKSWKEPITGKYRKCRCRHLSLGRST